MKNMMMIIFFIASSYSLALDTLMTEPVFLDDSFVFEQINTFVEYYAVDDLKDSGIVFQEGDKVEACGDSGVIEIYQKSRAEAFKALFCFLYASAKIKSARDCDRRWEYMTWFNNTGKQLGIPDPLLEEIEQSVLKILVNACLDLYQGKPLVEPVRPSF